MCCISWLAGGHEWVAFNWLKVDMSVLCFKGCRGHEHVAFHGLQVDMNGLHFMACRSA